MAYRKQEKDEGVCQECGNSLGYGRAGRKFCCDKCRDHYNYERVKKRKRYMTKVMKSLSRNYSILEGLLDAGVDSASIRDLMGLGFIPSYVTSHCRVSKHDEYTCFDIRYIMTATRLTKITKIQNVYLTLQISPIEDK